MSASRRPRTDPLPYRTRESKRAKRVLLHVLPEGAIEVVIPVGFDHRRIPAILKDHELWIRQALARVEGGRESGGNGRLPETVDFRAAGRVVSIVYASAPLSELQLVRVSPTEVRILGDQEHWAACHLLLRRWLRDEARSFLIPWLDDLGSRLGLPYAGAQVRHQRTRWGSCSSRGAISLNEKLLFLPPGMVQYVLIHELCHTVHMSHSPEFWALVRRMEPECATMSLAIRRAGRFVPPWAS